MRDLLLQRASAMWLPGAMGASSNALAAGGRLPGAFGGTAIFGNVINSNEVFPGVDQ